jgi:hypothetical protein
MMSLPEPFSMNSSLFLNLLESISREIKIYSKLLYFDSLPLASNFLEAGGFVNSRPDVSYPDMQLFLFGNLTPEYPEAGPPNRHGIALTAYVNRPRSTG